MLLCVFAAFAGLCLCVSTLMCYGPRNGAVIKGCCCRNCWYEETVCVGNAIMKRYFAYTMYLCVTDLLQLLEQHMYIFNDNVCGQRSLDIVHYSLKISYLIHQKSLVWTVSVVCVNELSPSMEASLFTTSGGIRKL